MGSEMCIRDRYQIVQLVDSFWGKFIQPSYLNSISICVQPLLLFLRSFKVGGFIHTSMVRRGSMISTQNSFIDFFIFPSCSISNCTKMFLGKTDRTMRSKKRSSLLLSVSLSERAHNNLSLKRRKNFLLPSQILLPHFFYSIQPQMTIAERERERERVHVLTRSPPSMEQSRYMAEKRVVTIPNFSSPDLNLMVFILPHFLLYYAILQQIGAVSYTHLTLPTNREV